MNISKGNRWLTLLIVLIGFFMILLDTTVVNVSIPTIIRDLGANISQIEWIISGYALSFAALLITFGRLGDLYGRRKMFAAGLLVFTIASLFSGEATSPAMLIVARLFQGVGGAMLSPATLSIISSSFRDRERAVAFGIFGAVSGIAAAVGPVLGGWLTTYHSWRWVFRVNIPIGILGIILTYLIVNESKAEKSEKIDFSGMITSGLGFFFLVFALIEGETYGWLMPMKDFTIGNFTWGTDKSISIIAISFILSVVFLVWFSVIQIIKTNRKQSPAVNFDFFKSKAFRYGLVTIAILALGEFSSLFTLPIFLQNVLGYTPLQSGYSTLPLSLALMVGAPISAVLVNKIGSKRVITTGILLETLGLFLLSRISADTVYRDLLPALTVLGFGLGLAIAQNTQVILSEINPMHAGSASGVLNTIRQVGTALGIAIIGAIMVNQSASLIPAHIRSASLSGVPDYLKERIATVAAKSSSNSSGNIDLKQFIAPPPPEVVNNPIALAGYQAQVTQTVAKVKRAVDEGLAEAISRAIKAASGFMVLGALCSLLIPNVLHRKEEELVG